MFEIKNIMNVCFMPINVADYPNKDFHARGEKEVYILCEMRSGMRPRVHNRRA
jgi:hypothetical protein